MTSIPVIFLDRDGVINEQALPHQYITTWGDFHYFPDTYDGIRELINTGFKIFIVSNQRCVARGIVSIKDIEILNQMLMDDLEIHGVPIDGIYYCPHADDEVCECRKPKTGMLLHAEYDLRHQGLEVDKSRSWIIGDFQSDIQTGINYGINTVKIEAKGKDTSKNFECKNNNMIHLEAQGLLDAAKKIAKIMEEYM